jgi:hypothetical protein
VVFSSKLNGMWFYILWFFFAGYQVRNFF